MRRYPVLILAVSALFLAVCLFCGSTDAADTNDLSPEERYPDADVILTLDQRGDTLMTFKAYGEYKPSEQHPSIWFTQTFMSSSDVLIRSMDDVDKKITIVMDGPSIKDLTLFTLDSRSALSASIDVDFTMVKGSIQTFSLFSVSPKAQSYIGTSYDMMYTPIANADIVLKSGKIVTFDPTSDMLAVTNLKLQIDHGMTIGSLYPTGENGKYSSVRVAINGATIGYMSNLASRIGYLEYDIMSGSIDYLSIGANTEHTSARNLAALPTSYVTGDVTVRIGPLTDVKRCIMGAGILNIPHILCNGTSISDPVVRMVVIDAPGTVVYNDVAFLNERRNLALHFGNYTFGESPSFSALMDTMIVKGATTKVYSEEGIWDPVSSCTLPEGSFLSMNADLYLPSDSVFLLKEGATAVNSGRIILYGSMFLEGKMVNNSAIQCRPDSYIEGDVSGIGYLADYIRYYGQTDVLRAMSSREAMVIEQEQPAPLTGLFAAFTDDFRSVSVSTTGAQRIIGDQFTIALTHSGPSEHFSASYRMDLQGIDRQTLKACSVYVTMPTDPEYRTAAYVYNEETGKYVVLESVEYASTITVSASNYSQFHLFLYTTETPNLPEDDPSNPDAGMGDLDYVLIIAIVAVLALTLRTLITMKRD